jgi:hypothetical protein
MGASQYLANLARMSRCRSATSGSGRRVFERRVVEVMHKLETIVVMKVTVLLSFARCA